VAWTSPKTWSFGEVLTSTDMNIYVRDNTQALFDRDRVLQVAQTVKTDTFSASVAAGGVSGDVTGLTVALTPVSTANRVLVRYALTVNLSTSSEGIYGILYRNGSAVTASIGDAAGSRQRVNTTTAGRFSSTAGSPDSVLTFEFYDSPATTSAQTYSVRLAHSASSTQTVWVNRSDGDNNESRRFRGASTITAMEVAG